MNARFNIYTKLFGSPEGRTLHRVSRVGDIQVGYEPDYRIPEDEKGTTWELVLVLKASPDPQLQNLKL
jgi:hypothetical protein